MEDGIRQPLRTEFQRTDAGWELLNFNTDFQATFVSNKPHRQFELLQSSLLQKDRSGFTSLLDEKLASGVMPAILEGFLTKAASILDPSQRTDQFSCLHEYQLGTRYERFASELKSKEGQPVRLEATFELQRLVAFVIRSPALKSIVKQIDDLSCFDDLAMTVVEQWMAGDFSEAKENFVPELRDGKLEERLRRLKSTLLITHGSYRESWLTGRTLLPELNAVECWVAVEFEQAVVPLKVTFEVDAFRCRVSGFEPELR
jgi:hypothetical protein